VIYKMKIVTAVVNNPVFIEIQYHTLKKYLRGVDSYEFIVFNDAKAFPDFTNDGDITLKTKIEEMCAKLGVQCISIPNEHHKQQQSAAIRCADSMNYILHYQLDHPDKYLLLDSDMFLIDYFDINTYFQYECVVLLQRRTDWGFLLNYIWNGIYYFDIPKLKNKHLLNWNEGNGGDVGGMMKDWLKLQSGADEIPHTDDLRWKKDVSFNTSTIYYIQHLWSGTWNEAEMPENLKHRQDLITFFQEDVRNPANGNFFCEIYDKVFLHYRAGGNWIKEGMNVHNTLTEKLKAILME
jgi:hypothetical protein